MYDSSGQVPADRFVGAPVSGANPRGALDQYEYGSVMLQRAGRYKVFTTGFSARPFVTVTPFAGAGASGSAQAALMGTAAQGSFRVRLAGPASGSINAHYHAIGPR